MARRIANGSEMIKAQAGDVPDLGLHVEASDGNRTRTISLGIAQIEAATAADLIDRPSVSYRG
jgi:hypothetical protein